MTEVSKDKFILDACCGPRMMWFNKHHPNALYIDNRIAEKGFVDNREEREVKPDVLMDFTAMTFPNKSFKLIVWDPPHLRSYSQGARLTKVYGVLNPETWQRDLKRGFKECWRVLDDYGILIFKWNDHDVSLKKILSFFDKEPLFGQKTNTSKNNRSGTYWFTFMKIP